MIINSRPPTEIPWGRFNNLPEGLQAQFSPTERRAINACETSVARNIIGLIGISNIYMFTATDHSWPSRVVAITAGMIVISRAPFCLKAIEACRDMVSGRYQAASTEDIPEIENEQPEELSQVELNNQNRSKDNIGFIHVV